MLEDRLRKRTEKNSDCPKSRYAKQLCWYEGEARGEAVGALAAAPEERLRLEV